MNCHERFKSKANGAQKVHTLIDAVRYDYRNKE